MRGRLTCELRAVFNCKRELLRATALSLGAGIWTLLVCRDVSLIWRISHHPPLTLPLLAIRCAFLAVCAVYGILNCVLGSTCAGRDRLLLSVISQAFFVLWYPTALLSGIFTLSFVALCFSAAALLLATARAAFCRAFFAAARVLMLTVMAYFAYIALGTAPLG